jgi:hypothetical protein
MSASTAIVETPNLMTHDDVNLEREELRCELRENREVNKVLTDFIDSALFPGSVPVLSLCFLR